LTLANMKAFQTTVTLQSLYLRITDLRNWISYTNGLLKFKLTESHWAMAQRLLEQYPDDKRREVAQKAANNRKQHLSMLEVAPFQSNDDVYEYLHLDTKDIFFLWAPILCNVTPEYLGMHDRAMDRGFHWLDRLEEQSYTIIARFALGALTAIPGTDYGEHARAIDLRKTSCAHEDLPWPPMCTIDCWSDFPLEAGVVEEVWPRPGEAANSPQDSPGVPMTVPSVSNGSG
jgi:hypothetical protein